MPKPPAEEHWSGPSGSSFSDILLVPWGKVLLGNNAFLRFPSNLVMGHPKGKASFYGLIWPKNQNRMFKSDTGPMYTKDTAQKHRRPSVLFQSTTSADWGIAFFSPITSVTPQFPGLSSRHAFMFMGCFLQIFGIIIDGKKIF